MVPWWAIQQRQSRIRRSRTGTGRGSRGGRRASHGLQSHGAHSDGSTALTCALSTWQQEPHTDMNWFTDLYLFIYFSQQFTIIIFYRNSALEGLSKKVLHSSDGKLNSFHSLHFNWASQQRLYAFFFFFFAIWVTELVTQSSTSTAHKLQPLPELMSDSFTAQLRSREGGNGCRVETRNHSCGFSPQGQYSNYLKTIIAIIQ